MGWHTISRVVAQYLLIYLDHGSGIASTYCVSTLEVYWTRLSKTLTLDWSRKDNVKLTMSWMLSTLNPGVVDERCAVGVHCFDLFGETNNSDQQTLYLGQWHLVFDLSHIQMEITLWRLVIASWVTCKCWSYQKPYRWIEKSDIDST